MRNILLSPTALCASMVGILLSWTAQSAEPGAAPGPCRQIVEACKSAGFVAGDYKKGYGLWVDCVGPIMHGSTPPANADKPLPTIPAEVVAACKQKNPNFGARNQGAPNTKGGDKE